MTANRELNQKLSEHLSRQEMYFQFGVNSAVLWGMVMLPLIPASLSFSAIVSRFPDMLHIPNWLAYVVAAFAAAGIEFLGLSAVKLALRMRKYNLKIKDTTFEHAPLSQGVIIATIYLITVVLLTVFLKVFPTMAIWSLLPLAGMGALADWLIALQADHNEREAHYDRSIIAADGEQEQSAMITQLNADIAKRDQQIEHLNTTITDLRSAINTQIDQVTAQLTAQLTATIEQQLADQANALTADYTQRIEQLFNQIDALTTDQQPNAEHLTIAPIDQSGQIPNLAIIRIDHQPDQPTVQLPGAKLYTNGHIADDLDHLSLPDKIKMIAQRMKDAGQKVNKSEIARLLKCSRTTVNETLGNDQ